MCLCPTSSVDSAGQFFIGGQLENAVVAIDPDKEI